MKAYSLPAFLGLLLALAPAQAAPIPGLFNSGVDGTGAALPAGTVDPHYQLFVNPDAASTDALVHNEGFPIAPAGPWLANTAASKWIAPRAETSAAASGDYTYRITFDLTGFDPTTAVITGRWSSDNVGMNILVNGVGTGLVNDGNFAVYTPFAVGSSNAVFLPGVNTLDFVVNNAGPDPGFTGLRVELAGNVLLPGEPPVIVQHPAGLCVADGQTLTLSVGASGTPPLSYQWRKNGINLPGENSSTFTLAPAIIGDDGGYDVIVGNLAGSVTSLVAQVRIGLFMVNPSFEADTFTIFPGYVANNGPITGWASLGNHGINPGVGFSPFADNGTIPHGTKVAFLQGDGALSQVVSAIVPGDEYYIEYYENSRTGGTIPAIEVRVGGTTIVPAHVVPQVGGANPYHRVKSDGFVAEADTLEVAFVKSNPQGGDTTALIDNVCFVQLFPNTPPEITQQPAGVIACVGDTVTFFARALGSGPLGYQWFRNGTPISDATNRTLTFPNVQKVQEGDYTMRATNNAGQVVTTAARLTVFEPIPDLFNTGVNSSRAALPDNSIDPHYSLIQNPDTGTPDAIVEDSTAFPIVGGPWVANTATSKWIGPRLNTAASAVGTYVYRTTIDLTDRDPSTVVILGRWAVDNTGTDIRVNGVSTGNPQSPGFDAYTSFAIYGTNAPFVAGLNTIDFVADNVAAIGYTGLRVEITKSNVRIPPGIPPQITQQPVSVKAVEGDPVTFTAAASGSAPLAYQWKKDGVAIPGATSSTFTLSAVSNIDSATYTVCVTNSAGIAVSVGATLCVCWRPVPGIFGTGLDGNGALLADGAIDPHYTLTASADPSYPGPDAFAINNSWPIAPAGPWVINGPSSRWIGPRAEQDQLINPAFGNSEGDYTFSTLVDLTGYDASQVLLRGQWAVDNTGLDIIVNGNSTGFTSPGFVSYSPFTISSGLVAGLNSIDFRMNNAPATPNPAGLRVDLRGLLNNQARLNIYLLSNNVAQLWWDPKSPCQRLEVAPTVLGPWVPHNNQANPQVLSGCTHVVALDADQDGGAGRTGVGYGTLTLVGSTLTLNNITYSGLSGNSFAAHIHGPADPGMDAGVLYPIDGLTTLGGTSGAFNGSVTLTAGTGGFSIADQLNQLNSGKWYINVHTTTFGMGEIRGQILPGCNRFFRIVTP